MAERSRKLSVSLAPAAQATLHEIWKWNAERYGVEHADHYLAFLRLTAYRLADEDFAGKPVPTRANLHYLIIKRRRRGHGHVAIYRFTADVIEVLDFFHTAQDWQSKLVDEE